MTTNPDKRDDQNIYFFIYPLVIILVKKTDYDTKLGKNKKSLEENNYRKLHAHTFI